METMATLARAALAQFEEIHADLRGLVRDLPAEALNWIPGEETNSIYVLVTHLLGSERFWVSAAVGQHMPRDRDAEFRAHGADATDLLQLIDTAEAHLRELLPQLTSATLDGVFTWRDTPRSGAWCLMHAIEHAGQHHGHVALTRQLWQYAWQQ